MKIAVEMITPCEEPLRFVELETLQKTADGCYEWQEVSRWIKLEEDIEEGSGRWSKPYIPKLTYKSLNDLKLALTDGYLLLDIENKTLDGIASRICECLVKNNVISERFQRILHAMLLARHHHHNQKVTDRSIHRECIPKASFNVIASAGNKEPSPESESITFLAESQVSPRKDSHPSNASKCMSDGSEATTILTANVGYASRTVVLFVRLKKSEQLGNLTELSLPVKFLYVVIQTEDYSINCHEMGRVLGTLMSYDEFRKMASVCQTKTDLLTGIDDYISTSSVLPPGNWDAAAWINTLSKWNHSAEQKERKLSQQRTRAKSTLGDNSTTKSTLGDNSTIKSTLGDNSTRIFNETFDPLARTGTLFGGLVRDVKRKAPHFKSDFTDAFNFRCLIALILVYFSFLAPAIAFAAILSHETEGLMGVSEMIVSTAVCGMIFGLFAGQPLIILGATGPLLIMEESIFNLSKSVGIEFLPWRVWIGLWITIFCTLMVAFDLSFLVRYFTLFTEEVIAAVTSAVFVQESLRYLWNMMRPLQSTPITSSTVLNKSTTDIVINLLPGGSLGLMAVILMFGTCLLCHYILSLRHSRYFPLQFRRLLSDFGYLLSVLIFLLFDILMKDDYSPKLDIPDGFAPTAPKKRGWIIPFFGADQNLSVQSIIFAIVPAFLVTIILFMETELTGTIIDREEHKLIKGSGYNLDLFMVGILVSACSVFGLPWMCACPVHSLAHLNSLSIFNNKHAPGTRAHVVGVIEQRMTNILMHLLIGLSVFIRPMLRAIPIAVLLGVLLFLGLTTLSHLHLSLRFKLLFIPPNNHPDIHYVRNVRTGKMHLFSAIQLFCLAIVLIIKNSILAPAFPFCILLMVPIRWSLKKFFTEDELEELDRESSITYSGDVDQYDVYVPM